MPTPTREKNPGHVKVGELIRTHREQLELSQRELAARMGLEHHTLISQFEVGATPVPPRLWGDLAKCLQMEPLAFGIFCVQAIQPHVYTMLFNALSPEEAVRVIQYGRSQLEKPQGI